MSNLTTVELKTFVPAKDFARSRDFYQALGFNMPWIDDNMAYMHHGSSSFMLQNFYVREQAENFVMHLLVEDVAAWHRHLSEVGVAERFEVRMGELVDQPWGMREFVLFDPSGVLWHIAQNI
ncbi:VOC family protein [Aquipseudomonas alcaligenes]|uniref:VOC family protein n=1 Tax=Aquipseudomonas alcaligenes TaxID=43263 RepID=UPI003748DCB3